MIAQLVAVLLPQWASANSELLKSHPGYLQSVEGERYRVAKEVVIIPQQESGEASLRDKIFSDKLTVEFKQRYEDRFGRTQVEQLTNVSSRYYELEKLSETNRTVVENQEEQERFGSYMVKRLTEYHVDQYMQNNPAARPVYQLKERVSNLDLQVKKDYKVRFKYSLSSGDLDIRLDNPQNIDNRISIRGSNETAIVLGYPVTKTISINSDYIIENNNTVLSGVKRLNNNWSTSLTGTSNDTEDKFLIGLGWSG